MAESIIDVLHRVIGEDLSVGSIGDLTLDEVAELGDAVRRHYLGWQPTETEGLRVHLGGWIGGNFGDPTARSLLATMLLYAHQVVIHDPLAECFCSTRDRFRALDPVRYRNGAKLQGSEGHLLATDGWIAYSTDLERNLSQLQWRIAALREIEPLLQSGAAVPVPHLDLVVAQQEQLLSAVRHDLRNDRFVRAADEPIDVKPVTTDFSRGVRLELQGAGGLVSDKDRRVQIAGNPSYYLNKTLAVAASAGASYMPPSATDWALYQIRIDAAAVELRRASELDLKVMAALHTSELPLLDQLSLETVARLRSEEGLLEDWRVSLRKAARSLQTIPIEGTAFASDSRQVLEDMLLPAERELAKDGTLLARLRRGGRDASVALVAGAAAGVAATAIGGPPAGLLASGASAAAGWTLKALLPVQRSGIAQIVTHLKQTDR